MRRIFKEILELRLRVGLRLRGVSRAEVNVMMESLTPGLIEAVAESEGVTLPKGWDDPSPSVGEGERPIIDMIVKFLSSDTFKALVQALIAALLGGL